MNQKKSQHYNYTHETIPIMWHQQYQDFLKYLDKDGLSFCGSGGNIWLTI